MNPRVPASWPLVWLALSVLVRGQDPAAVRPADKRGAAAVSTTAERVGAAMRPGAARAATDVTAKAERITTTQSRLSVHPIVPSTAGYRLLDAAGREIKTTTTREGALEAVVDPKHPYMIVPRETPRRALTNESLQLPARYVTIDAEGRTHLGGLFLRPMRVPLVWDPKLAAYATELLVGYDFQDGPERRLAAPKTVNFFTEGSDARIEADTVVIESSGSAGYKRVRLTTRQRDGETLFIARAGPADELKSSVTVHRELGAFELTLAPAEVPGLGIGTGVLNVSLLALDGLALSSDAPFNLQLSSRRLRHPSSAVVPAGQSSVAIDFRSVGLGADAITVHGGGVEKSAPVRLVFPVAASLAPLLGGLAGGAARFLRNGRKRGTRLSRRLIEGALVGVIAVAAAWAGLLVVDISAGVLGTPFGAFVLAALAGYLGTVVLDRIARRTFGPVNAGRQPAP